MNVLAKTIISLQSNLVYFFCLTINGTVQITLQKQLYLESFKSNISCITATKLAYAKIRRNHNNKTAVK